MADRHEIVQAYRRLYRQGLRAVNYSTPSRHLLLQTLRSSFRSLPDQEFNSRRVANTLDFLQKAANVKGFEHKIVKNLIFFKFWDQRRSWVSMRL